MKVTSQQKNVTLTTVTDVVVVGSRSLRISDVVVVVVVVEPMVIS